MPNATEQFASYPVGAEALHPPMRHPDTRQESHPKEARQSPVTPIDDAPSEYDDDAKSIGPESVPGSPPPSPIASPLTVTETDTPTDLSVTSYQTRIYANCIQEIVNLLVPTRKETRMHLTKICRTESIIITCEEAKGGFTAYYPDDYGPMTVDDWHVARDFSYTESCQIVKNRRQRIQNKYEQLARVLKKLFPTITTERKGAALKFTFTDPKAAIADFLEFLQREIQNPSEEFTALLQHMAQDNVMELDDTLLDFIKNKALEASQPLHPLEELKGKIAARKLELKIKKTLRCSLPEISKEAPFTIDKDDFFELALWRVLYNPKNTIWFEKTMLKYARSIFGYEQVAPSQKSIKLHSIYDSFYNGKPFSCRPRTEAAQQVELLNNLRRFLLQLAELRETIIKDNKLSSTAKPILDEILGATFIFFTDYRHQNAESTQTYIKSTKAKLAALQQPVAQATKVSRIAKTLALIFATGIIPGLAIVTGKCLHRGITQRKWSFWLQPPKVEPEKLAQNLLQSIPKVTSSCTAN